MVHIVARRVHVRIVLEVALNDPLLHLRNIIEVKGTGIPDVLVHLLVYPLGFLRIIGEHKPL